MKEEDSSPATAARLCACELMKTIPAESTSHLTSYKREQRSGDQVTATSSSIPSVVCRGNNLRLEIADDDEDNHREHLVSGLIRSQVHQTLCITSSSSSPSKTICPPSSQELMSHSTKKCNQAAIFLHQEPRDESSVSFFSSRTCS